MASKTLIGGVEYEIAKGRALYGGTGYTIQKGRTLEGGSGYDVSHTLTLKASGSVSWIDIHLKGEHVYGGFETQITEDDVIRIVGYYRGAVESGNVSAGSFTYFCGTRIEAVGKAVKDSYVGDIYTDKDYYVEFVAESDLSISVRVEKDWSGDNLIYVDITGDYTII